MRTYDDEDNNIQQYAPVLRRIIILIAVIIAVPVVLWTITEFMRTYIAQPVMPSPKPLAVTEAAPLADTSANSAPAATVASAPPTAAVAEARALALQARSADLSARRDQLANPSATSPASDTATTASVQPTAPVPAAVTAATALAVAARPQAAPSASDVFPNPPAAFAASPEQARMPPTPAAAVDARAADDALPPPDPITGPVPMPRHRPAVLALVETGVVPLPRARPAVAPEPEKATTDTQNVYDPGLGPR